MCTYNHVAIGIKKAYLPLSFAFTNTGIRVTYSSISGTCLYLFDKGAFFGPGIDPFLTNGAYTVRDLSFTGLSGRYTWLHVPSILPFENPPR